MTTTHSKSTERPASTANGLLMLLVGLLLLVGGPVLVAQDPDNVVLVIGVVRAVEITISAIAPEAAIRGATATALASRIRIRN